MICPYRLQNYTAITTEKDNQKIYTEDYIYEQCKKKDCGAYNKKTKKCEYKG